MTSSPAQSLLCPVLIGREVYLETMEQILNQAKTGQGQTILLAGEARLGKSRLTAEFKSYAVEQGWHCLQGDCFENERNLPYTPIGEIFTISWSYLGISHTIPIQNGYPGIL